MSSEPKPPEPEANHPFGRRAYDQLAATPPVNAGGAASGVAREENAPARRITDGKDHRGEPEKESGTEAPAKEPRSDRDEDRSADPHSKKHGFLWIGIGLGVAILLGLGVAIILYVHHRHALRSEAARLQNELAQGPQIVVATVHKSKVARELTLPADVRAFLQTTMYAKVSGYVKSFSVDKGDAVHQGDVIATLETPEVDQQVAGAAADKRIKKLTFDRYRSLARKDFISAEDFDTARSQYGVSVATLKQNEALQGYKVLRAPFDGTVTARYADPGALIPASTGSTTGAMPLIDLAQLNLLRVTLFVQQDAAPFIQLGDPVTLTADEQPQLKIEAKVSRISHALDPRSRAMLCEIWLKNDYHLLPGTFMHAKLQMRAAAMPMMPTGAVLVRNGKTLAAVVNQNTVKFVAIAIGVDDGQEVQVVSGLREGDQVGVDVPSELSEGARVRPIAFKPQGEANKDGGGNQDGGQKDQGADDAGDHKQ